MILNLTMNNIYVYMYDDNTKLIFLSITYDKYASGKFADVIVWKLSVAWMVLDPGHVPTNIFETLNFMYV